MPGSGLRAFLASVCTCRVHAHAHAQVWQRRCSTISSILAMHSESTFPSPSSFSCLEVSRALPRNARLALLVRVLVLERRADIAVLSVSIKGIDA